MNKFFIQKNQYNYLLSIQICIIEKKWGIYRLQPRTASNYYVKRKTILMNNFDKFLGISKRLLVDKFSEEKIKDLHEQMRKEYEELIPEIPYIGGNKNPFTIILLDCISSLPMIRALEKEGMSYREIGKFTYDFWEASNKIRAIKAEKKGQDPAERLFKEDYVNYMKLLAGTSQKRKFDSDWVFDFVDGKEEAFDYGYNFSNCGVYDFYKKQGAEKYVPFVCLSDFAEAHMAGCGLTRTQTIGNGDPICDHRYTRYGTTNRAWPPDSIEEFKMELD